MKPFRTIVFKALMFLTTTVVLAAAPAYALFGPPADKTYATFGQWDTGYQQNIGKNGICYSHVSYPSSSQIWVGSEIAESDQSKSWFLSLYKANWTLKENATYRLNFKISDKPKIYWVDFGAVKHNDGRLFLVSKISLEFANAIAFDKKGSVVVFTIGDNRLPSIGRIDSNKNAVMSIDLSQSAGAIREVVRCRREALANPVSNSPNQRSDKTTESYSGTGFFISSSGHVLTNEHVVKACSIVQVAGMDSSIHNGRVMASDERNDLALISTDFKPSVVPSFRTSGTRIGENIWVYGFPLAGLLASSGNFTGGSISAMAGLGNDIRVLQISAPVQPGNSGGPLMDQYGNVVGVVVGKLDALSIAEKIHDLPQNINFAIKSSIAVNFLEANGARPNTSASTKSFEQAEIADRARYFTVHIKCEPGTSYSNKDEQRFAKSQPTPAAMPSPPSSPEATERTRFVAANQKFNLDFLYSLEADCSSVGFATVRIVQQPEHGKVSSENGTGFSRENLRYECNKRRTEGVMLSYEPAPGYTGPDSLTVDVIYPSGNLGRRHYSIEVK
jgi:S1-C subfamily serine protease